MTHTQSSASSREPVAVGRLSRPDPAQTVRAAERVVRPAGRRNATFDSSL